MSGYRPVLIVEDEIIIAMTMEFMLKSAGWPVCGRAARGEEAIQLARTARPGLILMDIRLAGDLDGVDAVRAIREFSSSPVIFISGYQDPVTRRRAMELEPLAFLDKPVVLADLDPFLSVLFQEHSSGG